MQKKKTTEDSRALLINQRLVSDRGGGENFDIELGKSLTKLGVRVDYLSMKLPGRKALTEGLDFASVHLIRLPEFRQWYSFRPGGFLLYYLDRVIFQAAALFKLFSIGRNYQAIGVCGWPGLVFWGEKIFGFRMILRMQGKPDWLQLFFIRRCSRIVANGDVADFLESKGVKIKVINPGIDEGFLKCKRLLPRRVRFVYSGRLVPIKNLPLMMKAFAKSKTVKRGSELVLLGEGIERDKLKKLTRELKISNQVKFLGFVDRATLRSWLSRSTAFVISSKYDNYPNSVLEAMAVGLPVVATRVGGIPKQVINDKGGVLVREGDEEGFARAMDKLAGNRGVVMKMGTFNRKRVKEGFDWEKSARIWSRFLTNHL